MAPKVAAKKAPAAEAASASEQTTERKVSSASTGPKMAWLPSLPASIPRWNHIAAMWDGKLWVVGGASSVAQSKRNAPPPIQIYDFATKGWSTITPADGSAPAHPGTSQATGALVDAQGLVVFGGWNPTAGTRVNTVSVLSLELPHAKWTTVATVGNERPPPLTFHSCCAVGKRMIVFGGNHAEGQSNDTYILETSSWSWSIVPSALGAPPKRSSHTATIVNDHMVVVGGRGDQSTVLGDVAVFDVSTGHWILGVRVEGQLPPRYGHSAVAVGHNVVVFGGVSEQGALLNDVWVLDCEKLPVLSWSRASQSAAAHMMGTAPPTPATAATAATHPTPTSPQVTSPSGRAGHTMHESMTGIFVLAGRTDTIGYRSVGDFLVLDSTSLGPAAPPFAADDSTAPA